MSRTIRILAAAATVAAVGLATAGSASAVTDLKPGPRLMSWPVAACDLPKFQYIIDASATNMCQGDGVLVGPGWWWRGWPGMVNGGQHYMSYYDAPTVPDGSTASTFRPTITAPGFYQVWVSWRITHNRAEAAPYYVYADDGQTYRIVVNQKGVPGEDGFRAVSLGTFYFGKHAKEKSLVTLTNAEGTHSKGSDALFMKYVGPLAPGKLTASDATSLNKIVLKWGASPGAKGYQIYRSVTPYFKDAVLLKKVATAAAEDSPLAPGVTRYYWVRTIGEVGTVSALSNMDKGSTGQLPAVPTGVSASDGTSATSITVTWNKAANAAIYRVFRVDPTDPARRKVRVGAGLTVTTFTDKGLSSDTRYIYFVQAVNRLGKSALSKGNLGNTAPAP